MHSIAPPVRPPAAPFACTSRGRSPLHLHTSNRRSVRLKRAARNLEAAAQFSRATPQERVWRREAKTAFGSDFRTESLVLLPGCSVGLATSLSSRAGHDRCRERKRRFRRQFPF